MTDNARPQSMSAVECEVILKETAIDYIVKTSDGTRINVVTTLPDIRVGTKGRLVTMGGMTTFIREPYGLDEL